MRKIILTMIVISSFVFGFKVIDESQSGSRYYYLVQCSSGITGDVIYNKDATRGEQYTQSHNVWKSYGDFYSAASALCSK